MQKVVLPLLFVSLLTGCKEEEEGGSFTISGTLKNSPGKVVYAEESIISTGEKKLKDSASVDANGKFSMNVKATEESLYNLRLQNEVSPFATIINDANKISIDADFKKQYDFYSVSGSKASEVIRDYLAKLNEMQRDKFNIYMKVDSIRKNKGDSLLAESLNAKQKDISNRIKDLLTTNHPAIGQGVPCFIYSCHLPEHGQQPQLPDEWFYQR